MTCRAGPSWRMLRVVLLGLLTAGCAPNPPEPESPPLATFDMIRSRLNEPVRTGDRSPAFAAVLYRLDLPLTEPIDSAWSLVEDERLSPVLVNAWRVNGLRAGYLHQSKLDEFVGLLPRTVSQHRGVIVASADLFALRTSPRLRYPARVDLAVPPQAAQVVTVRGGECQLLSRVDQDASGRTVFELIPHHHVVRATVLPRTPQAKALEGRIFDELALRVPVEPDELLIIAMYRPAPPKPIESDESDETDKPVESDDPAQRAAPDVTNASADMEPESLDTDGQPTATEAVEDVGPTVLPYNLGMHLLSGRRGSHNVQIVLLVGVVHDQSAAGAEATSVNPEAPDHGQ